MNLQLGYAQRPCAGHLRSGDAVIVRRDSDAVLFGIIDVLGHGSAAADVAEMALDFLTMAKLGDSIAEVLGGLHEALKNTRGAGTALCLVRSSTLQLSIVGNVEVRSLGTRVAVMSSPGVLGRRIRRIRTGTFDMQRGDRVVLFSDGVSSRLDVERARSLTPEQASDLLLGSYGSSTDDASVVVADFQA